MDVRAEGWALAPRSRAGGAEFEWDPAAAVIPPGCRPAGGGAGGGGRDGDGDRPGGGCALQQVRAGADVGAGGGGAEAADREREKESFGTRMNTELATDYGCKERSSKGLNGLWKKNN